MRKKRPDGIEDYKGPAGGWGALKAVALSLKAQQIVAQGAQTLYRQNKPDGFDCPSCAWPDPKHTSSFEFCENGAKAVAWESTAKRIGGDFFAEHSVCRALVAVGPLDRGPGPGDRAAALQPGDRSLRAGRLGRSDGGDRRRARTRWAIPIAPNSTPPGAASNEAAFLYQLFVRLYGTNNFPDCSNMCHEATSVGLPKSIGIGKGTVSLEDFDHADLILSFGHNPGTNHPRMMATLRDVSRRGGKIIVFNPLRERSLERFESPQSVVEMATFSATPIASDYLQVKVGGDAAAIKGICKALLALRGGRARTRGAAPVLDHAFIAEHSAGFEALVADLDATRWADVEHASAGSAAPISSVWPRNYAAAKATIVCYGMGITQHSHGHEQRAAARQSAAAARQYGPARRGHLPVARAQQRTGRPHRRHLRASGRRDAGSARRRCSVSIRRARTATRWWRASRRCVTALPRRSSAWAAISPSHRPIRRPVRKASAISISPSTSPPSSTARTCSPRRRASSCPASGGPNSTIQAGGPQSVTVEDSMSMVHASRGFLKPPSEHVRSEPWIVAQIAKATLGARGGIDWDGFAADYDLIRDKIEAVFPDFADYNARIRQPGGFHLPNSAAMRVWKTDTGKANFLVSPGSGGGRDHRGSRPCCG